jgi:DNA-binding transcriptional ArsR family regulator
VKGSERAAASTRWWLGPDTVAIMRRVSRALEVPVRLRLLAALVADERDVMTLVRLTGYAQPQVSKQLRVLRELRIVQRRAQRTRRLYQFAAGDPAAQALRVLLVALVPAGKEPGQP